MAFWGRGGGGVVVAYPCKMFYYPAGQATHQEAHQKVLSMDRSYGASENLN